MAASDWIMRRGEQQAMYRYLPGRWIDFYIKSSRTSYAAYVRNWNSEPIEGVNSQKFASEFENAEYISGSIQEVANKLLPTLEKDDIVIGMGAGTITNLAKCLKTAKEG